MLNTQLLFLEEEFLHYYWQAKKLIGKTLQLIDESTLEINHFGYLNRDSGPDFFNAQITINGQKWAGNIEMHLRSSDWQRHKHQEDAAYNNVVLHVVYHHDDPHNRVQTQSKQILPTLELKNYLEEQELEKYLELKSSKKMLPCEAFLEQLDAFDLLQMVERSSIERLDQKSQILIEDFEAHNDWQAVMYKLWLKCFGLRVNQEAFEQLGRALPYKILQKHSDQPLQIEALLQGVAGFLSQETWSENYPQTLSQEYHFLAQKYQLSSLPSDIWKFHRLRPASFPTLRLAQLAALIPNLPRLWQQILEAESLEALHPWLQSHPHEFWMTHYTLGKKSKSAQKNLSKDFQNLFIINGIVPLLFAYGKIFGHEKYQSKALQWLESLEAEKNSVISRFTSKGFAAQNAFDSQGILQLHKHYCEPKKCLQCSIGQKIVR